MPEAWWPVIRAAMPAYDPARRRPRAGSAPSSSSCGRCPGARRSAHPQVSFAALGPRAEAITAGHALDSGFGERSPLARVDDLDGDVLLLGAGHGSNSSLHLAEYRVPVTAARGQRRGGHGAGGPRAGSTWEDVVADESDFERLGAAFDATGAVAIGPVGEGEARLMRQRALVAFGVAWMAGTAA